MIRDSASMSVMIETIGSRNLRWLQRKRDDFLARNASSKHALSAVGGRTHLISRSAGASSGTSAMMPHSIVRQNSRLQHAVSSLSSSSNSSNSGNGSGSEEETKVAGNGGAHEQKARATNSRQGNSSSTEEGGPGTTAKVTSSSGSSNDMFHDYHAPSLEDPLPESGRSSGGSTPSEADSDECVCGDRKHTMCTDSSSSEEEKVPIKKQKLIGTEVSAAGAMAANNKATSATAQPVHANGSLPPNIARSGGILHSVKAVAPSTFSTTTTQAGNTTTSSLPNGRANMNQRAPAQALPPFVGIGKRTSSSTSKPLSITLPGNLPPPIHNPHINNHRQQEESNNSKDLSSSNHSAPHLPSGNIITIDNDMGTTSSQSSSQNQRGIQATYHINEDDMILTEDVLMCPFIFRSQEAVWCGALAECVQPGMLRAAFSPANKLRSVEMIFDAMGFCQQLERASGNEGMAQIVPNSLEMALAPNSDEARVITLSKEPFQIVSVNEEWTAMTGYTQLDAEGKDLGIMLEGKRTDDAEEEGDKSGSKAMHDFESVANGVSAASTNIHYDINGKEFLDFMCSYPLSNFNDEVTHILHVFQELPARESE